MSDFIYSFVIFVYFLNQSNKLQLQEHNKHPDAHFFFITKGFM